METGALMTNPTSREERHHPDRCDATRTDVTQRLHRLRSSIVSVYYGYLVWLGSGGVPRAPGWAAEKTIGVEAE
ncbi:hypothetical protein EYF80_058304 [Liparis tanakae]|uniref:Uncharacterized protein n=1 Tax=Liparis tanakae TaxID=230148 RepID=A0A4Z2ET43_9TELE|nr:hypothetical protein EYF80_058304 [Liparis tanakae]